MSKYATRGVLVVGLGAAAVAAVVAVGAAHAEGHRGDGFGRAGGGDRGARLERMFERADQNGDGVVTMAEIQQSRASTFAEIDVDADGGVTAEELVAWRMTNRAERAVARFDDNGDGVLSLEEFPFRGDRMARFDLNEDGEITRAELELVREMRGGRGGARWRDGDGALD